MRPVHWLFTIPLRLRSLFRRTQVDQELDDELRDHLDRKTEEYVARGMTHEDAHRHARLDIGGIEKCKEECRSARRVNWIQDLTQDLRYGLRTLLKNPGYSGIAIIILGLGIGVNTTIFSFIEGILLRQPPIKDANRVMMLCSTDPRSDFMQQEAPVSAPDFLDWRGTTTSFSSLAAAAFDSFTLSGSMAPTRVPGGQVSATYFQVMGVAPIRGREFVPDEDQVGHSKVVILSEDLWQQLFARDSHAIGESLKINSEDYTIIGVVPSRFRLWMFPAKFWIPLDLKPEQLTTKGRADRFLNVFGRLKPGVSQLQAHAELATIADRLAAQHPETNKSWGANVVPLGKYMADMSNTRPAMSVLMGAVIFVLLIACANLTNLVLARNTSREHEFALRAALGAGRFRLARQLLSECMLISAAGAGLGLAMSTVAISVLRTQLDWNDFALVLAQEIHIDRTVLLFTIAVSVMTTLAFGLVPALQISRSGPVRSLKETSRSASEGQKHRRFQNLLLVGELALSLILLTGAGLFVRSFIDELRVAAGFNPDHLLTASVSLSGPTYKSPARRTAFAQNLIRELESSSEVQSVALSTHLPFQFPWSVRFTVEGQPEAAPNEQPSAGHYVISPSYFHTTQIPLVEGREFTPADHTGTPPVVIVNEAFVRKYFPKVNPLGRHIKISRGQQASSWSEIVGVSANVNEFSGQLAPRPHVFEPLLQEPPEAMKIIVRTRGEPTGFSESLRTSVVAVDKDQAITLLQTMNKVIQDSGQGDDVMAELMGTFAGLALVIAAVGVYGLLAYLVGRRTREFGVRVALGARRTQILSLVMRGGMVLITTGAVIGFLISLTLPRLFAAMFTGFHINSGLILIGVPVIVMLVAVGACYIPARRATKLDPIMALRYE